MQAVRCARFWGHGGLYGSAVRRPKSLRGQRTRGRACVLQRLSLVRLHAIPTGNHQMRRAR